MSSSEGSSLPLISEEGVPILKNGSKWSVALFFSVFVACLNSIQYGYHMSELNAPGSVLSCQISEPIHNYPGGPKSYLDTWFGQNGYAQCIPMDDSQIGIITSIFSIAGLIASIFIGGITEKFGRKTGFVCSSLAYAIGSMIEFTSNSFTTIAIGRFVSGLGAGAGIVTTPIYINEISPVELRGVLGSMNQVSINGGILLTQVLAINWSNDFQWRLILAVGAIIGAINFVAAALIHESPKWVALKGNYTGAFNILTSLRNGDDQLSTSEMNVWKMEDKAHIDFIRQHPHLENLQFYQYLTDKNYFSSRIIAAGVMIGQQFCGINSIIFYGVKILINLFPKNAVAINCMISVGNMVITFVASLYLDRLGRKPMLLSSVSIMGVASVLMCIGIISQFPTLSVLSTFLYVGSFACGCGPIPFLLISEVSQNEVRGFAQSWGTSCNWFATFLVGILFPIINAKIGGFVYLIFAFVCVIFVVFISRYIPETKGKKTYQEVWGIEERSTLD
ncbi:hypothetical protein B5S30_g1385 [[Candida] boidinii]|nr:hypothetical protein B5S30_g1385 [[Candida] boidinii]